MSIILAVLQRVGARGKKSGFEELYRELYRPVVGFFLKKGLSMELSEELAQDTFLRVHGSFDQFRFEAKPSTWVLAIAQNLFRNHLRDRATLKRQVEEVSIDEGHEAVPAAGPGAVDRLADLERQRLLHQAIGQLPTRMRQCVWIRISTGESYREIAARLGVGPSAVKSQVFLATERLRALLGDHYPELEQVLSGGETNGKDRHDGA